MKKEVIGVFFVLSLLVIGCAPQQPTISCSAPYKTIGSDCCLDGNENNMCDDREQKDPETCKTDEDCELDACTGCINTEWAKANPARPECARYGAGQYECKCINNACAEVEKVLLTKIAAGDKVRFGEEKLPISLEMQRNTRILFTIDQQDEVYELNELQESQITIFYGKDRFVIKKGASKTIGPLTLVYTGVNPPKSGNYAMIKVIKAEVEDKK